MEQRNILFSEFLDARSLELANMEKVLSQKPYSMYKLAFQLLPKHMRRRPMSHNKYRIPSRIRKHSKEEPLKKPANCRKHLRRARLLSFWYKTRSSRVSWLETHLFQAKRMKMHSYFGYKIALHSSDKSRRANYRFFNNDAVMYDLSYYFLMEIRDCNSERNQEIFKKILLEEDFNKIFSKASQLGLKTGEVKLWREKNQGDLIGPVEYFWRPTNIGTFSNYLYILAHPGMKSEISELLPSETFKIYENSMNVFHIFGPNSLLKVSESFNQLGISFETSLLKFFSLITDPAIYPKGSVFYIKSENFPDSFLKKDSSLIKRKKTINFQRKH